MLKRVSLNDLFFDVEEKPLKAIVGTQIIESKDYFMLSNNGQILGVKPLKPSQKRLFVENEVVCDGLGELATKIDNHLSYYKSYINERRNKAFIFLGLSDEKDNNVALDIVKEIKESGFRPALAVSNGYDYNDKLFYYLLLELKIKDKTFGYLTIAKYHFTNYFIEELLKNNEFYYSDKIVEKLLKSTLNQFAKAYEEFYTKYQKLKELVVNEHELTAVTLDIYNKNRNIEAIKSDENLKKELTNFVNSTNEFYYHINANNLSHILNHIVRYQTINFGLQEIADRYIYQALQEKKVYKNVDRLFKGKNANQSELKKYIKAQVDVLDEVIKIL